MQKYLEIGLDKNAVLEVMGNDLRADILRVILENISDICVESFNLSTVLMMYTYERLYIDSSLFYI